MGICGNRDWVVSDDRIGGGMWGSIWLLYMFFRAGVLRNMFRGWERGVHRGEKGGYQHLILVRVVFRFIFRVFFC